MPYHTIHFPPFLLHSCYLNKALVSFVCFFFLLLCFALLFWPLHSQSQVLWRSGAAALLHSSSNSSRPRDLGHANRMTETYDEQAAAKASIRQPKRSTKPKQNQKNTFIFTLLFCFRFCSHQPTLKTQSHHIKYYSPCHIITLVENMLMFFFFKQRSFYGVEEIQHLKFPQ